MRNFKYRVFQLTFFIFGCTLVLNYLSLDEQVDANGQTLTMEQAAPPTVVEANADVAESNADANAEANAEPKPVTEARNEPNDIMYIMPWDIRWNLDPVKYWYKEGLGPKVFESCPESRCELTDKLNISDAVLISHKMMLPLEEFPDFTWVRDFKLPIRTNDRQKWIFFSNESPEFRHIDKKYLNIFNATFTYKRASAGYYPYGRIMTRASKWTRKYSPSWKYKQNVAWMVSNCDSLSGREKYVAELAKYIDVTIFGKCGNRTCARLPDVEAECFKEIESGFKFYLAFENSLCNEYASEKLWRSLTLDMIPIVFGIYDYKQNLPSRSVIDVRDFDSPQSLAKYLKRLSNDANRYSSYFRWKEMYYATNETDTYYWATCQLCEYLHKTKNDPPTTVDLGEYWGEESNCISRDNFLMFVGVDVNSEQTNMTAPQIFVGQ